MSELLARFSAFRVRVAEVVAAPAPRGLPEGLWEEAPTPDGPVPVRGDHRPLPFAADLAGPWPARLAGTALGPPEDWRFLDLETTGLRGGRAFLAGVAHLEGGGLTVRQFLLEDLDREAAFLQAVAGALDGASAVVTFNGKTFDIPLLRDRAVLSGTRGLPPLAHWDVLHAARRLWRDALGACDLRRLQDAVLRAPRTGDVPGALIPELYRAWLEGEPRALDGVCAHNREDLFALAAVAARICAALQDGPRPDQAPAALRGLARCYERAGDAEAALRGHLARGGREAALEAARLLKRLGRGAEAVPLWEAERRAPLPSPEALIELAKHLEHRRRDPQAALAVVREALAGPARLDPARREGLLRRLRRLQRRIQAAGA